MTFFASDPVPSGLAYAVVSVADAPAASLEQFTGEVTITIDRGTGETMIAGVGSLDGECVRFQEKDIGHDGKDVRVWEIRPGADGAFTAASLSTY
jgi:hypothetical protein